MAIDRLRTFAPVNVSDQAIYNRIERAGTPLQWLFDQVSTWLRKRLTPWEDHRLAPWATAVSSADACTLDRMSRFLPWLCTLAQGDARLLSGQISALCDVRLQHWVRVDYWPHALDHCKTHVQMLVEHVQAGALLLCDRGYFSFAFCDQLSSQGIWWMSRSAH
jgi:hypothetical protein